MQYIIKNSIPRQEIEFSEELCVQSTKKRMCHELASRLLDHLTVSQEECPWTGNVLLTFCANILSYSEIQDIQHRGFTQGRLNAKKEMPYGVDDTWE